MWVILGALISLVMGGMELAGTIDVGWWCVAPFIAGIIIQIVVMAAGAGDGCSGCLGGGLEGIADIFD